LQLRALLFATLFALGPGVHAQGLPDLGDASSASLSDTQERTIGNRIMRDVRTDPAYVDDPEISDYLNSLGQRLLLSADGPRRDIDFFVVNDDTINAFALVGGHIGVHTGLIALTQNESELAGVVAHEIAHILQRHQARMMHGQRAAQWTSLAALALAMIASRGGGNQSGQVTEAAIASAGALQIQSQLNYTREHEREADRVGVALMERAGYDPHGMVSFFERLLRANRLNELKGAPSYLRTHPLTTERIADMQDRVQKQGMAFSMRTADSLEYRLARAKIQAMTGSASQAVEFFRTRLEDKTVVRPREDVYGLALAQRRARDLEAAWNTLQPLREASSHPAFELLAAQIAADRGQARESLEIYRAALRQNASYRALYYAYLGQLVEMGRDREALTELDERLRVVQDDWRLYDIQARAYEHMGKNIAQHRALAEAYYRRGNLSAAVDQLEIAVKVKGSDFYESSMAESRLRELRAQLENQKAAEKALNIS
jgi:predicted Zn-dependent protease